MHVVFEHVIDESTGDTVLFVPAVAGACLGTAEVSCGHSHSIRAVYDQAKSLQILQETHGLSESEAREFLSYHAQSLSQAGAPVFLRKV